MAKTKEIQRRIKSVGSIKKVTRAMEMVAASKMRRSVEAVLKTRTYSDLAWLTILNIAASSDAKEKGHPLLDSRAKTKKIAIVLISSNRGLCGSFNSNIVNKAVESLKEQGEVEVDFILVGKKGIMVNSRFKHNVSAEFEKADFISEVNEVRPIARMIIDDFLNEKYDKVFVTYTDFVNSLKQVPRVKQILPVDIHTIDEYLGVTDDNKDSSKSNIKGEEFRHLQEDKYKHQFIYEPSPQVILDQMLPRLIEIQLFQALLESNASEHSVRMSAMHQATEAATDLAKELLLSYNKARQAAITSEISEISAGANALGLE